MTKKHFIELADYIRIHREAFSEEAIGILANFCKAQNGNFNRERWLDYINFKCGPNGGKVKQEPEPAPAYGYTPGDPATMAPTEERNRARSRRDE